MIRREIPHGLGRKNTNEQFLNGGNISYLHVFPVASKGISFAYLLAETVRGDDLVIKIDVKTL
jgi:hypothetical protein